jgi:hypothetical protein
MSHLKLSCTKQRMRVARRFGAIVSGTGIRATSCAAIVRTVTVWRFFRCWPPSRG